MGWPSGHVLSRDWFRRVLVDFTFWFFSQGKGVIIDHTNGISHSLHPGVCLCMKPGMDLEARQSGSEALRDNYFHITLQCDERVLPVDGWPAFPFYTEVDNVVLYEQTTRKVIALLNQSKLPGYTGNGEEVLAAEFLLKGILLDVMQTPRDYPGSRHYQDQKISTALSLLYENPKKFTSVEDLAEASGYSTTHFRSLCIKLTGEKPKDILINARIEHAKKLLRHSDLTIGMIAEEIGYESIYYFSKQFREVTGMTASSYKNQFPGL